MKSTRIITAMLLCLTLAFTLAPAPQAATTMDSIQELNIDVIFCLDRSGSMIKSDPHEVAKEACKLFVDMCDYSVARAGYVFYSGTLEKENSPVEVVMPLSDMTTEQLRNGIKDSIDSIEYAGNSDISLGLTKAKDLLVEGGALREGRNPMIILLSDGKDLIVYKDREDALAAGELDNTLTFLKDNGVPVYTIGLNADKVNPVDEGKLNKIATETNGKLYLTSTADDLDEILPKIYASQLGDGMVTLEDFTADGMPREIKFNVTDNSVYQAAIVIQSTEELTDVSLKDPNGDNIVLPTAGKATFIKSKTYTLIKIAAPAPGEWTLNVTGVNGDSIKVLLLNSHDALMELSSDKDSYTAGDTVTLTVTARDPKGDDVGTALFDGAMGNVIVRNTETGKEEQTSLIANGGVMSASITVDSVGRYTAEAQITGKYGSYNKITKSISFEAVPPSITVIKDVIELNGLFTPVLLLRLGTDANVEMRELFDWGGDANEVIFDFETANGQDVIACDFDKSTQTLSISAVKAADETVIVHITGSDGQEELSKIEVHVKNGMWIVCLIVICLLFLATIGCILYWLNLPPLTGFIGLRVKCPSGTPTPPQGRFELMNLSKKKGAVPLPDILSTNANINDQYESALKPISEFVKKIKFCAVGKNPKTVKVTFPKDPGVEPAGGQITIVSGNYEQIIYTLNSMEYVFTIGLDFDRFENNNRENNENGFDFSYPSGFSANYSASDGGRSPSVSFDNGFDDFGGFGGDSNGFDEL